MQRRLWSGLMRVLFEWIVALGGSTPADGSLLLLESGPRLLGIRLKIWSLQAVGNGVLIERCSWAVAPRTLGFLSEVEQATAVRMVPRGCACDQTVRRGSGCGGDSKRSRRDAALERKGASMLVTLYVCSII